MFSREHILPLCCIRDTASSSHGHKKVHQRALFLVTQNVSACPNSARYVNIGASQPRASFFLFPF
jgi:hypothetical protein